MLKLISLLLLLSMFQIGTCLMCYKCSPGMPGCNPFNWRGMGYLGSICPEDNDICVKLIERKGADELVTRDCLSNLQAFRTDVPADKYEGCRPASTDIRLAHYVNNSIKELDIRRDHYDQTTWCFCFLDHRCNGSSTIVMSYTLLMLLIMKTFLNNVL